MLTHEQKAQICGILSVGCDRQTAADYIGCALSDLRTAMQQDPDFLASVRRSEAGIELSHMRNVQQRAQEKNEWKASVWWLERRSPERFARRAGTVTTRQLKAFVAILVDILGSELTHTDDRNRVLARLQSITKSIEQMFHDLGDTTFEPTDTTAYTADFADDEPAADFSPDGLLEFGAQD